METSTQFQLSRLWPAWGALDLAITRCQERLFTTMDAEDADLLVRLLDACAERVRELSQPLPRDGGLWP